MKDPMYVFLATCVVAVCTYFTRALPFLLFRGKELPSWVKYLGRTLPQAIMVILVCYCLKGIRLSGPPYGIPEFGAVAVVLFVQLWRENLYLSIITGTLSYMLLLQLL